MQNRIAMAALIASVEAEIEEVQGRYEIAIQGVGQGIRSDNQQMVDRETARAGEYGDMLTGYEIALSVLRLADYTGDAVNHMDWYLGGGQGSEMAEWTHKALTRRTR